MSDDSAIAARLVRVRRRSLVGVAALALGSIALSGCSVPDALATDTTGSGTGIAAQRRDAPSLVESHTPSSASSIDDMSRPDDNPVFRLSKDDPLGFAMMMAQIREFERLAAAERRREIRKARAAKKLALAKKRAAAKRRAEARRRAAEKKRVAAAKKAEAKRKQAEIDARSSKARGRGGLVVGDSVALGAESCLKQRGYRVDAVQSRSFQAGLAALRQKPQASLPAKVVIHLGTNGPFNTADFHAVMSHIGGDRHVTWVTIALPDRDPYGFETSLNRMIKDLAGSYNNTSVADWNGVSQGMGHWFAGDQIHINSQGCEGFARVVDAAGR